MALMALMISLSAAFTYLHQGKSVTLLHAPGAYAPMGMHIDTAAMSHTQIGIALLH